MSNVVKEFSLDSLNHDTGMCDGRVSEYYVVFKDGTQNKVLLGMI